MASTWFVLATSFLLLSLATIACAGDYSYTSKYTHPDTPKYDNRPKLPQPEVPKPEYKHGPKPDVPKPDVTKSEYEHAPKPDVPKLDVPKPEYENVPKPDVPKVEVPKPDYEHSTKPDVSKPEVPKPEYEHDPKPEVPKPEYKHVPQPETPKPKPTNPEYDNGYAPKPTIPKHDNYQPEYDHIPEENPLDTGVEGLVLCKSGSKYIPIKGAVARIICSAEDENGYETTAFSCLTGETNEKGYFLKTFSLELDDKLKLTECKTYLESSPLETCNVPSDVNKGITGALLSSYRILEVKKLKLYSVGPFFFTPESESTSTPAGY